MHDRVLDKKLDAVRPACPGPCWCLLVLRPNRRCASCHLSLTIVIVRASSHVCNGMYRHAIISRCTAQ